MMVTRRIVLVLAMFSPLAAFAACSATNGDAIPNQVYDASPLDPGSNPGIPEGGTGDAGSKDSSTLTDAPADAPKEAAANVAPVQIDEIYVDTVLGGDGTEYVELRAAPGTPTDDLKLRLIHADGQVKYEITAGDPGEKFGASGLWVVGGAQTFKLHVVDHVDHVITASGAWGLDTRGAVQVVRGTTLLDVVGYVDDPDAGPVAQPSSPPKSTVEGKPALVPDQPSSSVAPARSFGRKTGAVDTNDNSSDFCKMTASPGHAQNPCE